METVEKTDKRRDWRFKIRNFAWESIPSFDAQQELLRLLSADLMNGRLIADLAR